MEIIPSNKIFISFLLHYYVKINNAITINLTEMFTYSLLLEGAFALLIFEIALLILELALLILEFALLIFRFAPLILEFALLIRQFALSILELSPSASKFPKYSSGRCGWGR